MSSTTKFVIGGIVVVLVIGVLIATSFSGSTSDYLSIAEVKALGPDQARSGSQRQRKEGSQPHGPLARLFGEHQHGVKRIVPQPLFHGSALYHRFQARTTGV